MSRSCECIYRVKISYYRNVHTSTISRRQVQYLLKEIDRSSEYYGNKNDTVRIIVLIIDDIKRDKKDSAKGTQLN